MRNCLNDVEAIIYNIREEADDLTDRFKDLVAFLEIIEYQKDGYMIKVDELTLEGDKGREETNMDNLIAD